jgi:hypothetical protein
MVKLIYIYIKHFTLSKPSKKKMLILTLIKKKKKTDSFKEKSSRKKRVTKFWCGLPRIYRFVSKNAWYWSPQWPLKTKTGAYSSKNKPTSDADLWFQNFQSPLLTVNFKFACPHSLNTNPQRVHYWPHKSTANLKIWQVGPN